MSPSALLFGETIPRISGRAHNHTGNARLHPEIGEKYLIRSTRGQPTIFVTVRDDSDKKKLESLRRTLRVIFSRNRVAKTIHK